MGRPDFAEAVLNPSRFGLFVEARGAEHVPAPMHYRIPRLFRQVETDAVASSTALADLAAPGHSVTHSSVGYGVSTIRIGDTALRPGSGRGQCVSIGFIGGNPCGLVTIATLPSASTWIR